MTRSARSKLDRIEDATLLDEAYAIPPTFDPKPFLRSRWGDPVGRPLPRSTIVPCVDRHADPGVRPQGSDDPSGARRRGTPLLRSRSANGPRRRERVRSWIASWGPQMKVLEPTWLRERILRDLDDAIATYADEK